MEKWQWITIVACVALGLLGGYVLGTGSAQVPCEQIRSFAAMQGASCEVLQRLYLQGSMLKWTIYGTTLGVIIAFFIIIIAHTWRKNGNGKEYQRR